MFMQMKGKSVTPKFITGGVDIHVDRVVKESSGKEKAVIYRAFVFTRDNHPELIRQLAKPDNQPWYCKVLGARKDYDFGTEGEVAKAVSAYVNHIKWEYFLKEFDYKVKACGYRRTETVESITCEEAERMNGSIEDLLK